MQGRLAFVLAESYSPKERELECLANCFQSKICELVTLANSPSVYMSQLYLPYNFTCVFWSITYITAAPQNVTDSM